MVSAPRYMLLVPYYSRVEYLRDALASVLAQTDRNWSLVVVDDSPTGDEAPMVVAALDDERCSYVRNERTLGVAGCFNRCFEVALARGAELAVILHADDVLEPRYVEVMKAAHGAHPEAVCVAPRVTVIDASGRASRALPDTVKGWLWPRSLDALVGERGLQLLLRGKFFYCPSVSYRLALVPMPAWSTRWQQVMDLELYAQLLLDGGSIALEPSTLFRYRRHEGSMTQINSATMLRTEEEIVLLSELARTASAQGWRRAARAGRFRMTARLQALMRVLGLVAAGRVRDALTATVLAVRP